MNRRRFRFGRVKGTAAIAGLAFAAIVATMVPGVTLTNGTWNSNEWDNSSVGALDCAAANTFKTRAGGKFLTSNTLPAVPANVVDVKGITVTNNGTLMTVDPAGLAPQGTAPSTFYTNPLDAQALGSLQANLTNLIKLPLDTSTGVYNQYAQALNNGKSAGAAGAVNNSGAIALTGATPAAGLPGAASLDLTTLLNSTLTGLGSVAGAAATAKVGFGAVSSSATLDACGAAWSGLATNLVRAYRIASLNAVIGAPLVGTTATTVGTTLGTLQSAINALTALTGPSSLLGTLTSAVTLLAPGAVVSVSVAVDNTALQTLQSLLTTTQTDTATTPLVKVNLAAGTVDVDIAQLVGGLNGRDPNTPLVLSQAAIDRVTAALTTITSRITAATTALVSSAKVNVTILAPVLGGTACIKLVDAPLNAPANTVQLVSVTGCSSGLIGVLGSTLAGVLNVANLGTTILGLVATPLTGPAGLITTGVVTPLANNLVTPLTTLITPVLSTILGPGGLLALVVNEQNAPTLPAGTPPTAASWTVPAGRYEVAALGLQVPSASINIDLARSSVGTSCPVGGNVTPCAGY